MGWCYASIMLAYWVDIIKYTGNLSCLLGQPWVTEDTTGDFIYVPLSAITYARITDVIASTIVIAGTIVVAIAAITTIIYS